MKFGEGADPRAGRTEYLDPEYKISYWTGSNYEEYVLVTEADADEVLAWAADNADGRHYSVWVRTVEQDIDGRDQTADVRLVGTDPPTPDDLFPSWARRPS